MYAEGILLPGNILHTFLQSLVSPEHSTFDPVALFVSALKHHCDCPPTLLKALADSQPNHNVWLASHDEEKHGLNLNTYPKHTLGEYWALREKRARHTIPKMCVLTIKKDKNLLLLWAKSHIVILGNHEDSIWSKSDKLTPVLRGDSLQILVSLAIQKCWALHQGNCKNAFCQGILPPEEVTIVRLPSGDPDPDPNKYGFF
jgi:hypothetical protein